MSRKPHVTLSSPELYRFHPQLKFQCQGEMHGGYGETIGEAIRIYYRSLESLEKLQNLSKTTGEKK